MPSLMRRTTLRRGVAGLALAFAGALALAACSKTHQSVLFTPGEGHPDGWVADHGAEYRKAASRCAECHGADLTGGIAAVSCYSTGFDGVVCHPAGPAAFIHSDTWAAAGVHGPTAKAAPGAMSGLAWCQGCHGRDFGGGTVNTSCGSCHGVSAPHPRAPWRGGAYTHVTTAQTNAPVCAGCHLAPGPRGEPGCFNATLCHGPRGVHPGGWGDPGSHGATAKRAPGGSKGLAYCQQCHGADFRGGEAERSCSSCHGVAAPHPRSPWRGRYTHTTTDPGNAAVCIHCHRNRRPPPGAEPGCFNNTLCHPHEPGWAAAGEHGAGAKERPSPGRGFPACQSCHGRLFAGGDPGGSCFRAGGCHTQPTPHSPGPWRGGVRTHTTTNGGNVGVCAICHRRPSAPPSLADNCFNTSLCHGQP